MLCERCGRVIKDGEKYFKVLDVVVCEECKNDAVIEFTEDGRLSRVDFSD